MKEKMTKLLKKNIRMQKGRVKRKLIGEIKGMTLDKFPKVTK